MAQTARLRQKEAQLRESLLQMRRAIDAYREFATQGGITLAPGASGCPPTLEVLAEGVVDVRTQPARRVVFLRRVPRDPFAEDERQADAQTWRTRAYASPHDAPREGVDVFDVQSRSERLGLNGRPYNQW